jgi:DNA-binding CsgD family transcriptional regulator
MKSRSPESQHAQLFRKTGLFFAITCTVYLLFYLGIKLFGPEGGRQIHGLLPMILAMALLAFLFLFSIMKPRLAWIQPVLLLAMTPLPMIYAETPIFSLGVFIAAEILFYRLGFFERLKLPKFILTILYFFLCQTFRGVRTGESAATILVYLLFLGLFLAFLLIVYGERWILYLKEPRPQLFLSSLGLSEKETLYLKALLEDKSMKEIAIDHNVKESTVRNTLARVYRKFEVTDKSELKAKCARFSLKD